jgi:hypothetical protein
MREGEIGLMLVTKTNRSYEELVASIAGEVTRLSTEEQNKCRK